MFASRGDAALTFRPLILLAMLTIAADAPPRWGHWTKWGAQDDGRYRNPVLPADFSDLDAIRVGDDYYAISSTLHVSPGMAVLHSRDLVNWRMIGHVVPDLSVLGEAYRGDRMGRFGRGVWAGTIRHHAGRFYVFFGTPDEGFFMASAADPAGPWTPLHPLLREAGWDDCSVLWDDDGRAWFVGTKFADGYKTYLMPMSADGRTLDRSRAQLLHEGRGREASKLLKVDGRYYLIFSEHVGQGRYVVARRADKITGPWSEIKQLAEPGSDAHEPNQGGIMQAQDGRWWFLTHHGAQDWEGRAASLLPVTWVDGWPIIGAPTAAGPGQMVWEAAAPVPGVRSPGLQTSDEFGARAMGPQWEFNHQPAAGSWSLTARRGWLRLNATRPIKPGDLVTTANMPSQRSLRTPDNSVTVKLDLRGMKDGQHAGLAHVGGGYAGIGVGQADGARRIEFRDAAGVMQAAALFGTALWLRSHWGSAGVADFSYSADGTRFVALGRPYQMRRASYRGDRIGLFSYRDTAEGGGHVDVDWFRYAVAAGR